MPKIFSDIWPFIDRIFEIMKIYATEIKAKPLPRSTSAMRTLSRLRGSAVGVEFAEAFQLIRELC